VPGGATPLPGADALGRIMDRVVGRTGMTPGGVRMLAMAHYNVLNRRTRALLSAIERLSRGLAGARGRKSILAFSEGFLYDPDQRALFDRAIDASQRGNTAVYFVDAKRLAGSCVYGFDSTCLASGQEGQLGIMGMEVNYLETSGTEQVAENTGGRSIRFNNDLFDGMTRVTDESSTYYLLGYQPEKRAKTCGWRRTSLSHTASSASPMVKSPASSLMRARKTASNRKSPSSSHSSAGDP
jgi:VWFA-related protein